MALFPDSICWMRLKERPLLFASCFVVNPFNMRAFLSQETFFSIKLLCKHYVYIMHANIRFNEFGKIARRGAVP